MAGTQSDFDAFLVSFEHSSFAVSHQFSPQVCDVPNTGDSVRRLAVEPLFENYQIAEEILAGRDYFFDHFTAVDAHFFWCFRRGLQFELDVSKFANCVKHHERMKSRSSVQKLLAHEKAVQAEFAKAA
ncbi:MAG: hypothetical protein WBG18_14100 [Xanthobacteraceae bacterium]